MLFNSVANLSKKADPQTAISGLPPYRLNCRISVCRRSLNSWPPDVVEIATLALFLHQVLDTVDIKVFHRPGEGGSLISSNCYNANGTTVDFGFGIQPQSENGLFVRLNRITQSPNTYTVDYKNKTVRFNTTPSNGASVNIISVSGNGENVVEFDEFTGDGCTTQFKTKAHWTTKLDYIATVDGKEVQSVLVSSEDSAIEDPKAVIVFGSPPRDGSVINFAVYDKVQSYSKIETQEFTGDGSTVNFT